MVLLTVYYMFATTAQAWRFRSIYQKITRVLDNQRSVVFTRFPEQSDGEGSLIQSVDGNKVTDLDCIWTGLNSQGLSIKKTEIISLNPFITFPRSLNWIPFKVSQHNYDGNDDVIYALIEVDCLPNISQNPFVEVEQFGNLLAWKLDSKFSIMLQTNVKLFSNLIFVTFLQDQLVLNEVFKLSKVQNVEITDQANIFENLIDLSDSQFKLHERSSNMNWEVHFEKLRKLSSSVKGLCGHSSKPDLLSHSETVKSETPKKKLEALNKTEEKINELKVDLKRQEALRSPFGSMINIHEQLDIIDAAEEIPESPKFPIASSKDSNSLKSETSSTSQMFPASPERRSISKEPSPPKTTTKEIVIEEKKIVSTCEKVTETSEIACVKPPSISITDRAASSEILEHVEPPKPVKVNRNKSLKSAQAKPPNILVYSESAVTRDNVIKSLKSILADNTYTVYPLTSLQVLNRIWMENARLLIVCGTANDTEIGNCFLDYFFKGGKVLCLCSDLLGLVLPTYHTAEVREHELVQFTYGKWQNIKMMHHIFCYQPSPIRKHFSHDSDDPPRDPSPRTENPLQVLLRSVELKDRFGISHNIRVKTLGTEDTWKTPSLLMIHNDDGGKMIFSQIHLEIDPSIYENDEQKYQILLKNDGLRLEIFSDVLNTHLDISVKKNTQGEANYSQGYFLGRHELKFEVLEQLKSKMDPYKTLKLESITIKFCGKGEDVPKASESLLPVMMHTCPEDFSTLDYFDALRSESIGRLLIYSNNLKSSSAILDKTKYVHGFAVIPRKLTVATGRGGNQWLSPEGCLMFSLQIHVPLDSPLGARPSLVQHLVAVAVVSAIRKQPGCHDIDICVKWPNDIYVDGSVKIGGLIVNSTIEGNLAICNIGLGLNLTNKTPTTCINDYIAAHSKITSRNIEPIKFEKCLAIIFNEIEFIFNRVQLGDMNYLIESYYAYWLHSDASVKVLSRDGTEKSAQIVGIDDFGFLSIRLEDSKDVISVQPDGNTFDMIRGLILPKNY